MTLFLTIGDVELKIDYYVDETERGPFIVVEGAYVKDVQIYGLLDWEIQQQIEEYCRENEINAEEQHHERQYDQRKEDGHL